MSKDTEKTKGELYVIISGFFWASFSVLVTLNYAKVSGLYSLFYSIIFAIVFFAIMVHFKKLWHELKNKLFWKYVFYVGFTNGFLFYVFYLLGLQMTTPNNVSLLGQTEILFSYLFLNIYNKEYISKEHIVGMLFMVVGAMIILLPGFSKFNIGDLLIILAVMVGPMGNYFQKKVRQIASAESLLLGRNLISLPLIFLMIIFLSQHLYL